ncbi:hypothetical protein QFZ32_006219 [Streptomyces canus]|nr:hypothetical protein [Streptomyces canus]
METDSEAEGLTAGLIRIVEAARSRAPEARAALVDDVTCSVTTPGREPPHPWAMPISQLSGRSRTTEPSPSCARAVTVLAGGVNPKPG